MASTSTACAAKQERRRPAGVDGVVDDRADRARHQRVGELRHARRHRIGVRAGSEQRPHQVETVARVLHPGRALAADRRPRGHQRVQRGPAALVGGRCSGAMLEQERRDRVVAILDRHLQQALAGGLGQRVDVGAGGYQRPRRLQRALPGSERERGETALLGGGANVGAARDEELHHLDVVLRRRPHQRRLAAPRLPGIHLGAAIEERRHGGRVSSPRAGEDRRLSVRRAVGIGAGLEQARDHGGVGVGARQRERAGAVAIDGVHRGAGGDQETGDRLVVAVNRPVERRGAVGTGGIGVDALEQGARDGGAVTVPGSLGQRVVEASRGARRNGGHDHQPGPGPTRLHDASCDAYDVGTLPPRSHPSGRDSRREWRPIPWRRARLGSPPREAPRLAAG